MDKINVKGVGAIRTDNPEEALQGLRAKFEPMRRFNERYLSDPESYRGNIQGILDISGIKDTESLSLINQRMAEHQQSYAAKPVRGLGEGIPEAWAYGNRKGPGMSASLLDEFSPWVGMYNDVTGTTLQGSLDKMTGAEQMGYNPADYNTAPAVLGAVQWLGEVATDPLNLFAPAKFAVDDLPRLVRKGADNLMQPRPFNQFDQLGATVNPASLNQAKQMLADGVDSDIIQAQTGLTRQEIQNANTSRIADTTGLENGRVVRPPVKDGKIRLTHWSTKPGLDNIDPNYYGQGYKGAEAQRIYDNDLVNRTYYGIGVDQPGGYVKEYHLGNHRYDVDIPAEKMYDIVGNPDNLPTKTISGYEKAIKDAGYTGYWRNHPSMGVVSAVFDKVEIPAGMTGMGKSQRGAVSLPSQAAPAQLIADDVPRVNFPTSPPTPPALTRASVGSNKFKTGAPMAIQSPDDVNRSLDAYLAQAEAGSGGRDWYQVLSQMFDDDVGNFGGARQGAKEVQASVFGEFSPRTSVKANLLAATRANNQSVAGIPVAAGTGPRNKAAQKLLDESKLSDADRYKVGPFAMSAAGLNPPRGTHDFRDAIGWGYTPEEAATLGRPHHRYMDDMADAAVDLANKRKLGGYTDWTHEKLQAAQWVKHKADDVGSTPEDILQEMADQREVLQAKVYSEGIPSDELVDASKMSDLEKEAYNANYAQKYQNPAGSNALAQQLGLLAPDEILARGDWKGATTPNMVTTIMADPGKASDAISPWSKEAVNFFGSLRGLMGGQADVATSFMRQAKKVGNINAVKIPFDVKVSEAHRASYAREINKEMKLNNIDGMLISNYRSPTSLEFTWIANTEDTMLDKNARKVFRDVTAKVSNGRSIESRNSGGLISYADEYKPSEWMKTLQNPKMRAAVKDMVPRIAKDILRDIDTLPLTKTGKDVYKKAATILSKGGLDAVEKAVQKGTLPTAILGALLLSATQSPGQPSAGQDL